MAATRTPERASPVEFFEQYVAPVVFERLDELFPEFGFQRDSQGWRATNSETTHAFFGARAERVVCHQIGGFYVHGQGAIPWLSHLESGAMPRGRDYVDAVRRLARTAGVDTAPIDHGEASQQHDPQPAMAVREAWFQHGVEILRHSARGAPGRTYLESRGMRDLASVDGLVGIAPLQPEAWRRLRSEGHEPEAINESGVLADSRLGGRIVGAWRDESAGVATIWARSTNPDAPASERYLYLRGARKPALPYLAREVTAPDVVIVEGVFDALAMRSRGSAAAVALGGSNPTEATWRALAQRGVRHVWMLADHDSAGDQGCRAATRSVLRAASAPRLSLRRDVPDAEHKDMAALLAAQPDLTIDAEWLDERCVDCVDYETRAILERSGSSRSDRQTAFDEATRFLAGVPDAHALGRDAAIDTLAAWARVEPSTIHSLTHTREDTTALRSRVTELERAVVSARELLGGARLPIPGEGASEVRHAVETHERIAIAYRALDVVVPDIPDPVGVETPPRDTASLSERSVR